MQVMSAWQAAMFRALNEAKEKGNTFSVDNRIDKVLTSSKPIDSTMENNSQDQVSNEVKLSKKKSLFIKLRKIRNK